MKVLLVGSALVLTSGVGPFSSTSIADDTRVSARKPVSAQTLASQRGGTDYKTLVNLNDVHGSVDHNVASNVVTGNNTISASFAGSMGLPIVVQNSGNNVLIQNATIVNVQIK